MGLLGLLVLYIVAGRDLALPDSMRDTVAGRIPSSGLGRGPYREGGLLE